MAGWMWNNTLMAAVVAPAGTWSPGGSRTAGPVPCDAYLTSPAGSVFEEACGEFKKPVSCCSIWQGRVLVCDGCAGEGMLTCHGLCVPLAAAVPVPGYFLNGTSVAACPAGTWCRGGSRTASPAPCGPFLTSLPGSDRFDACTVTAGYTWNGNTTRAVPCPEHFFCPGGDRNIAPLACGAGMMSPAGAGSATDCGAPAA